MIHRLAHLWKYADKLFDILPQLKLVRDRRVDPLIPSYAVNATLLLGAILRLPSLLDIAHKTKRLGWQKLIGHRPISHDTLGYALVHGRPEDWRTVLVSVNLQLKANKRFEEAKIGGYLVAAVDANEQFKSRSRCCAGCCQRQIKLRNPLGLEYEVTEYYHREVYAQISGPVFSVVLDVEPIRPGEEEAAAALRLLGRIRRLYGARFIDGITVDAWYTKGPFLRAVEKLGWGVVSVLKDERYEIYKEASALQAQQPVERWPHEDRAIAVREVKDLPFTLAALGSVRVVLADETWSETTVVGGKPQQEAKSSHWRWLVTGKFAPAPKKAIWEMGHRRWGIENHTFNELTQHYQLEHCPRHEAVAIEVWLLIRVLGFLLFELFANVYCKTVRQGDQTLKDLRDELFMDLGNWQELAPLWSG